MLFYNASQKEWDTLVTVSDPNTLTITIQIDNRVSPSVARDHKRTAIRSHIKLVKDSRSNALTFISFAIANSFFFQTHCTPERIDFTSQITSYLNKHKQIVNCLGLVRIENQNLFKQTLTLTVRLGMHLLFSKIDSSLPAHSVIKRKIEFHYYPCII